MIEVVQRHRAFEQHRERDSPELHDRGACVERCLTVLSGRGEKPELEEELLRP